MQSLRRNNRIRHTQCCSNGVTTQRRTLLHSVIALPFLSPKQASARLEGVNKPELLPDGPVRTVLDPAGFLTPSEETNIQKQISIMERESGIKLRVLCQNYPETPGLAVKDYWSVDDDTVVCVVDPGLGQNILNFNVGDNVDLKLPSNFFGRVASSFGTPYTWQDYGIEYSVLSAVNATVNCSREQPSRLQCRRLDSRPPEEPLERLQ